MFILRVQKVQNILFDPKRRNTRNAIVAADNDLKSVVVKLLCQTLKITNCKKQKTQTFNKQYKRVNSASSLISGEHRLNTSNVLLDY